VTTNETVWRKTVLVGSVIWSVFIESNFSGFGGFIFD